jgi:hypothetical protein
LYFAGYTLAALSLTLTAHGVAGAIVRCWSHRPTASSCNACTAAGDYCMSISHRRAAGIRCGLSGATT